MLKSYFSNFTIKRLKLKESIAPPAAELFCSQSWVTGSSGFSRACLPSRSEFSIFFSKTHVIANQDSQKASMDYTPPTGLGPTCGQLVLIQQQNPTNRISLTRGRQIKRNKTEIKSIGEHSITYVAIQNINYQFKNNYK